MRKKHSSKKGALVALVSVLSVVLVALLGATIYVDWVLDKFYKAPNIPEETLSQEQISALLTEPVGETLDPTAVTLSPEDVVWGDVKPIESGEHIFNILLVGQDRRPGEARARSDSMILITINTESKQVYMTSIMRDLYVKIPGYGSNRINVPYAIKGASLLYDTLEKNFGLRPDNYVEVDFAGFTKAVDMVGGVDVFLTAAEARHLNGNEANYDFPGEDWHLVEGINRLDSKQALAFSRCRSVDGTGDFSRTRRQRDVLAALLQEVKGMSLLELNDLVLAMSEFITTDMDSAKILSYAATFAPMLGQLQIVNQRIPADNTYYFADVEGVGSVIVADIEKNREILAHCQN